MSERSSTATHDHSLEVGGMPQYSIQDKKEELYWLHAFECIGASSGLLLSPQLISSAQTTPRQVRLLGHVACDVSVGRREYQVGYNVDVAVCGFGIRTLLVCAVHKRLGNFALQPWQADVEASLQEVSRA